MMINEKSIEIVAKKSIELLDRQIQTYRNKQDKATTILGLLSLFLPIYLFVIEKSTNSIKLFSIIPIIVMTIGIIYMIRILRTKKLNQGYNPNKFSEFINNHPIDINLYEISSNKLSFEENYNILENQNKNYNIGLSLLIISIGLSISLLLIDITFQTLNNTKMAKDKRYW